MTTAAECRPSVRHDRQRQLFAAILGLAAIMPVALLSAGPAAADKIKHPIAVFSGLDKITGRIITFEVAANETVQFGSLQITERVCYSRPPTEAPQTDTFVEVDNIDANKESKRIFTGWMFAGSPSLHALDHPVYDIWLLRCKGAGELIASPPDSAATQPPPPAQPGAPQDAAQPAPPKAKRLPANAETQRPPPIQGGPIEVGPPPGFVPPSEQRPPSQNFNPPPAQNGDGGF